MRATAGGHQRGRTRARRHPNKALQPARRKCLSQNGYGSCLGHQHIAYPSATRAERSPPNCAMRRRPLLRADEDTCISQNIREPPANATGLTTSNPHPATRRASSPKPCAAGGATPSETPINAPPPPPSGLPSTNRAAHPRSAGVDTRRRTSTTPQARRQSPKPCDQDMTRHDKKAHRCCICCAVTARALVRGCVSECAANKVRRPGTVDDRRTANHPAARNPAYDTNVRLQSRHTIHRDTKR